jgi:CspA family cold shock protein
LTPRVEPGRSIANCGKPPYITAVRDFAALATRPLPGLFLEHAESGYRLAQMVARAKRDSAYLKEIIMATGTVKFFNGQKGFGFIAQDGGGPDVFVHVSAVERAGMRGLAEGQKITFDIEADRKSGKSAATNLQAA